MRLTSLFATLLLTATLTGLLAAGPVNAQTDTTAPPTKEPLPIEVSLMFSRLLKVEPNYHALMALNTNLKNDPKRFGNDALVNQQLEALKSIYNGFTPNTVFMVRKRLRVTAANGDARTLTVDGLTPDEPFIFELAQNERYGIFLRNAPDVLSMTAPYEYDDMYRLNSYKNEGVTYPSEILVRPLVADSEPFIMPDGSMIKALIADVVEITLLSTDGDRVAIQKRFNDWKPGIASSSLMDLKDNPLDNALVK